MFRPSPAPAAPSGSHPQANAGSIAPPHVPPVNRGTPRVGATGRVLASGSSQRQPPPGPPPEKAPVPSPARQKRMIQTTEHPHRLKLHSTVYLIDKHWVKRWESHVGYGFARAHPAPSPGPITNHTLLVRGVCHVR